VTRNKQQMKRSNIRITLTAITLAAGVHASVAQAADIEKGRAKAEQVCAACHGKDGNTPVDPSYPRLAGQAADYLYQALRAYQSGARNNPIMGGMAKPLTTAEMHDVAAYYESLPGQLVYKK
jgi:cytochrome c553